MSGLGDLKKVLSRKVKEEVKDKDGKILAKSGDIQIRGANCPKCGQFHQLAFRVIACNYCGFHATKQIVPTQWMINRHARRQRQQAKWKQEREMKKEAVNG